MRLRLREWRADEAQAAFDLLGSDDTMGTMRASRVHSIQEADEWLRKRLAQQQEHGLTMWAVERRCDGVLVGACGLFPQPDRLELGYIIDHRYRRQGYATEAAKAAVAAGQEARPGCRIYATIRPHNRASVGVAEAVGLHGTGTLEDDLGQLLVFDL